MLIITLIWMCQKKNEKYVHMSSWGGCPDGAHILAQIWGAWCFPIWKKMVSLSFKIESKIPSFSWCTQDIGNSISRKIWMFSIISGLLWLQYEWYQLKPLGLYRPRSSSRHQFCFKGKNSAAGSTTGCDIFFWN